MVLRLLKLPFLVLKEVLRHADFATIFRLSTLSTRANGITSYVNFSARYGLKMHFCDFVNRPSLYERVIYVFEIDDNNRDEDQARWMDHYCFLDTPRNCVFIVEDTKTEGRANELFINGERLTAGFTNFRMTQPSFSPGCEVLILDAYEDPFVFEPILNIFHKMGIKQMSFSLNTDYHDATRKAHAFLQNMSFDFKIVFLRVQAELGKEMFKYYLHKCQFLKYHNSSPVLSIEREEDSRLRILSIENGQRFKVRHLVALKECERVCIKNLIFRCSDVNQILKHWKAGEINLKKFTFHLQKDETDVSKLLRDIAFVPTNEPNRDRRLRIERQSVHIPNYFEIRNDNGERGVLKVDEKFLSCDEAEEI